MPFARLNQAPLAGILQRGAWFNYPHNVNWRVRVAKVIFAVAVLTALFMIIVLIILSLVPLAIIFTLPGLCAGVIVLALALPQLVYLYFAQDDVPTHAKKPFLAMTLRRCIQIDYSVLKSVVEFVNVSRLVFREWLIRKVTRKHAYSSRSNIRYGSGDLRLDIYWPSSDPSFSSLPVIVFIPPQIRPFSSRKLLFTSLGTNLAQALDSVIVIPDLTNYPEGRIKQQVIDVRKVLNWVDLHVYRYGGDIRKLRLSGLGMGGLLALLVPLQSAITKSRDQFLHIDKTITQYDLPNGVKDVKVNSQVLGLDEHLHLEQEYGQDIPIPKIEGLILFCSITNVDDQITDETMQGIQHLSTSRRVLGPGEKTCYFHSPAHLLYAARNIVKLDLLPSKILFIHGGLDKRVQHTQSETMKEIFRGVGVEEARVRLYTLGHWETVLPLMCEMQGSPIIDVLRDFLWEDNAPTPRAVETKLRDYK